MNEESRDEPSARVVYRLRAAALNLSLIPAKNVSEPAFREAFPPRIEPCGLLWQRSKPAST